METREMIKAFMMDLARIYGLDDEHGQGMFLLLMHSYKCGNELHSDAQQWRIEMNNKYGWKTYKPSTRVLRDLEEKGIIKRRNWGTYSLDPDIFGNDNWAFTKKLGVSVDYRDDASLIKIIREYYSLDEIMEEDYE